MIKVSALPKEFEPYGHLVFCSNVLIGTPLVFTMDEYAPILIGKGKHVPMIWVSLPSENKSGGWVSLIAQNHSFNKDLQVLITGDITEVKAGSVTVIRVRQISEDSAEVTDLDLNPFGFHITGTKDVLHIGGNTMARNMVSGSRAFIRLS